MQLEHIAELVDRALQPVLGPQGMDKVEVTIGRDHDDEESLFVTARYRKGSKVPPGPVLLQALSKLHNVLVEAGEERFPYLDHRFSDEQEFEEDISNESPSRR